MERTDIAENLLKALKRLDRGMDNDATGYVIGLKAFLIKNDCSYTHETAKILYAKGLVGKTQAKGSRSPLIFWNGKRAPQINLCHEILKEVRELKRIAAAKRATELKKVLPAPVSEIDILNRLRDESRSKLKAIKKNVKRLKREIKAQEIVSNMLTQQIILIQKPTK